MKKLIKPVLLGVALTSHYLLNRFKSVFILIAVLALSSCSVMKHKKESHTESSTAITQGSSSSTASVDTSKISTNEYWRITIPAKLNVQPIAEKFEPFTLPDLTGATDEQRKAAIELQKQYNSLRGAYNNQGQALDAALTGQTGMLIEMIKQTQENAGKSTSSQAQDSTKIQHSEKQDTSEKEKEEGMNWKSLLSVGAIIGACALFLGFVLKGIVK